MCLLLVPATLLARTWVVQQDGTGDFTDIQSAVDAAGVGDTVLVGPGRYDTFHVFPGAPDDWRVVVGVSTDSLTIRGIDRETAIIGPTEPYPAPQQEQQSGKEHASYNTRGFEQRGSGGNKRIYSKGIASGDGVSWITVENLTFENTDTGIQIYPAGEARDCVCRNMHDGGIVGDKAYRLLIERCTFSQCRDGIDIIAYGGGQEWAHILGCQGSAVATLVYNGGHPDVTMDSCTSGGGLMIVWGGRVQANQCRSRGGAHAVDVGLSGYAEVNGCEFSGMYGSSIFISNATLTGTGNIIHGADGYPTIKTFLGTIDLHDSHILHGNYPYTVEIRTHEGPIDAIDLRNNYWGTTSADTLAAWIWDGHDDPSVQTYVQYEPFSSVPIPTRKQSWGGVKALFR